MEPTLLLLLLLSLHQSSPSGQPIPPGVFLTGNGVTSPSVKKQVRPQYTKAASKAHITGVVLIEAIIGTDGLVRSAKVIKSLDNKKGLDAEALKAAKLWEFGPGMKDGVPVPVMVTIELTFTMK
jgi:TonB family protein